MQSENLMIPSKCPNFKQALSNLKLAIDAWCRCNDPWSLGGKK